MYMDDIISYIVLCIRERCNKVLEALRQYSSKTTQTMHTCRCRNDLLITMQGCSRGRSIGPPSAKKKVPESTILQVKKGT